MGRYACAKGRAAGRSERARAKIRPARTAQAGRTQACPGGGQGRPLKAAGGAAIRRALRLAAPARRRAGLGRHGSEAGPLACARFASKGQGAGKCLSGLRFFMACWLGPVLTCGFYPEIMALILGGCVKGCVGWRSFS